MQRIAILFVLLSLLVLALAVTPGAPTAEAIGPCTLCDDDQGPNTRCLGVCQGIVTLFCGDFWHLGCTGLLVAPTEDPKESFLASLRDLAEAEEGDTEEPTAEN